MPGRLLDTRTGGTTIDGQFAGIGIRRAGSITELQVNNRAGVATDATAAALNITITEPTTAGFVTVYPCDAPLPATSSVNFAANQTIANTVITKTSPTGTVCLYTSTTTHLVADVNGAYPNVPIAPI